jgi:uncharacterized membrane protein
MTTSQRYPIVDAARGFAIVLMVLYHFCYDLDYFSVIAIDMNQHPFWLGFRAVILSLFLGIVGVSLVLATSRGLRLEAYSKRLVLIAGYAGLISLGTYFMFGDRMIYFGVLHFIAVASVLGLLFVRFYYLNLVLGLAMIAVGVDFQHPFFDAGAYQWIGLMTHKPATEDYVPLLPWFGVVLIGMFLGRLVYLRGEIPAFARAPGTHPLTRTLVWGGRYSIHIYMLHQPLLLGVLYVVLQLAMQ